MCAQLCPIFCNPMNCSLLSSSVHGIFQARILKWIVIPSPGDLPDPGTKPRSPVSPAVVDRFFTNVPLEKPAPKPFSRYS